MRKPASLIEGRSESGKTVKPELFVPGSVSLFPGKELPSGSTVPEVLLPTPNGTAIPMPMAAAAIIEKTIACILFIHEKYDYFSLLCILERATGSEYPDKVQNCKPIAALTRTTL
jgi:hypothetical protein